MNEISETQSATGEPAPVVCAVPAAHADGESAARCPLCVPGTRLPDVAGCEFFLLCPVTIATVVVAISVIKSLVIVSLAFMSNSAGNVAMAAVLMSSFVPPSVETSVGQTCVGQTFVGMSAVSQTIVGQTTVGSSSVGSSVVRGLVIREVYDCGPASRVAQVSVGWLGETVGHSTVCRRMNADVSCPGDGVHNLSVSAAYAVGRRMQRGSGDRGAWGGIRACSPGSVQRILGVLLLRSLQYYCHHGSYYCYYLCYYSNSTCYYSNSSESPFQ
jgi:hypothetical protein